MHVFLVFGLAAYSWGVFFVGISFGSLTAATSFAFTDLMPLKQEWLCTSLKTRLEDRYFCCLLLWHGGNKQHVRTPLNTAYMHLNKPE